MVFVRVGQEHRIDVLADQIGRVRADQVDAGRRRIAERHADIDDDPAPRMGRPVAIGVQVHADFAAPAEGQEYEFVCRRSAIGHQVSTVPFPDFQQSTDQDVLVIVIDGFARAFE